MKHLLEIQNTDPDFSIRANCFLWLLVILRKVLNPYP